MLRSARKLLFGLLIGLLVTGTSVANAVDHAPPGDKAVPLRWPSPQVRLAISTSLLRENPNIKTGSDVSGAIRRSLAAWSSVVDIEFTQVQSDRQNVSSAGPAGDGVSLISIAPTAENVLLFLKDPLESAATTRIFYGRAGEITEADIVFNPYQQFSTDGTPGTFDLESTLTHELGHLLGLLGHSPAFGSTMSANSGRNGIFGLPSFSGRTLSLADISAIRSLYGAPSDSDECCASVNGRLRSGQRPIRKAIVWAEDADGRVAGTAISDADGRFEISGLAHGRYRLNAQEAGGPKLFAQAQAIGDVTVDSPEGVTVDARLRSGSRDFEFRFLGFNGQLSEMAVALNSGKTYLLYIGGRNLDPESISVAFSSDRLTVIPGSMRAHDYGPDVSVLSFEVRAGELENGDYSIYLSSRKKGRAAIVGGITVDGVNNPFSTFHNPTL